MAKRLTKRKILLPVAAVVLLLVVVIALLPALISGGLGHGMIRNAIEDQIEGTADFQQLRVSWFGPQTITGLRLVDDTGKEAAVLDASVDQGLLPLIFTRRSVDATIAGVVRADLYEDGSTSLARLARDEEPERDEPLNMEGVPALRVNVAGVTLYLHDVPGDQEIVFDDLRGMFVYVPGADLNFDLQGATESGEMRGSLAASGDARGLFDRGGRMVAEGTPLTAQLTVSSIPVPGVDVPSVLHNLSLNMQSQNVAQFVSMNMQGQGTIQDEQPSRFTGEFRVRNPIRQDGTIDIDLNRIEGQLTGEGVPSTLLQPAFNDTPIVLARDIGRTIDLDLQLLPGDEGVMTVRAIGPRATVELSAVEQDGWWMGDNLVLRTDQAHPDLVEGYTGLRPEEPTDLEIVLTAFAIPPFNEEIDARPLGLAGLTGTLRVDGPTTVLVQRAEPENDRMNNTQQEVNQQEPMRFTLSNLSLNIDTAQVGDALYVNGSLVLDGGQVQLDQTITNLADAEGRIVASGAEPVGTATITDMPYTVALQFMPEQEQLLRELIGQTLNATVRTQVVEEGLRAELDASGEAVQARFAAVRMTDALRLLEGRMQMNVTPALAESVLADLMEEPAQLTQAAAASLEIAPVDFPGSPPFDYEWRGVPVTGVFTADNLALAEVPGTVEPVGLNAVQANVNAVLEDQWTFGLDGQASLMRPAAERQIASLIYNINAAPREDEPMAFNGSFAATQLAINDAEALLGQDPDALANWVGRTGALRATFRTVEQRYEGTLTSELERLTGEFAASLADQILTLNTDAADIDLAAAALENMLNPDDGSQIVDIVHDVPFRLVLRSTMPLSLFTDEPYDAQQVDIDAELTGGPLVMISEDERTTLSNAIVSLRSEPVPEGLDFIVRIDADIDESPVTGRGGEIDVQARIRDMTTPETLFNLETATLDMNASVVGAPAAIADAMLNMHGYFFSAVGHEIDATINADNFSRNSGTLSMDMDFPHGWLRLAGEGRDGVLAFAEGSPIEGELALTPLLREQLLRNLHPLLGDIVALPQPLHVMISEAMLPLDGDISRLNADIAMTIGEVDFDARSPLFALLQVARVADVNRLDGFIEPIQAQIRNGVIDYDQFIVTVAGRAIPYQGQINLVDRTVNLRTAMPLGELVLAGIREVPEEARGISVPIVTRGAFGSLETRVDPEFDLARAMLEAGVRRGLDEIIPRDRLPFDLRDFLPRR